MRWLALRCGMGAPAIFLDRDGVINEDLGYVHTRETFRFIPGVFKACRLLREMGFRIIVVTNQPGIARGLFSMEEFNELSRWMMEELVRHDAAIDAVYVCPHHPDQGIGEYRVTCDCRMPQPGLIRRAAQDWDICLPGSVLVGDRWNDMLACASAMVGRCFLLPSASGSAAPQHELLHCDVAESLLEVALRLHEENAA